MTGYDRHIRECHDMSRFETWGLRSQEQDTLNLASIHVPWNLRGCLLWNVSSALCIAPQMISDMSWENMGTYGNIREHKGT